MDLNRLRQGEKIAAVAAPNRLLRSWPLLTSGRMMLSEINR